MTRRAQPYPEQLCRTLAHALLRNVRNRQVNYSDLALAAYHPGRGLAQSSLPYFENLPFRAPGP